MHKYVISAVKRETNQRVDLFALTARCPHTAAIEAGHRLHKGVKGEYDLASIAARLSED